MAQTLNHHQAHWSLYLSCFDYSLIHRASRHSAKPDALSRQADHRVGGEDNKDQVMLPARCFDQPVTEVLVTRTDPSCIHIKCNRLDFLNHVCDCADRDKSIVWALKELGSGANLHGEEWEENNSLVLFRGRVYIPLDGKLCHDIIEAHHDTPVTGHPSWWKTTELVARNYWWPGMGCYITKYVKGCNLSATARRRSQPLQQES